MAKFNALIIGPEHAKSAVVYARGQGSSKRVAAQRAVENLFNAHGVKGAGDTYYYGLGLYVADSIPNEARILERFANYADKAAQNSVRDIQDAIAPVGDDPAPAMRPFRGGRNA